MRAFLALLRREHIAHRGAFIIAPSVLLAILTVGLGLAIASNRLHFVGDVNAAIVIKVYQTAFIALAEAWWAYVLLTLFFYYADAFSADRRNNAMLFWKSMPVSDLRILASKMVAGLLVLPAIVYVFAVVTGVILYALAMLARIALPGLILPAPEWMVLSVQQVAWFELCQFVVGLLWYAPFFAWVGLLSTLFGRWSIPLSVAIPAVVALIENAVLYGTGPTGGYVWAFLSWRLQFGVSTDVWWTSVAGGVTANVPLLTTQLLAGIDWVQLGIGLPVAALFVWLASLYRRRGVAF
jgi:ABC-2 type transport system permease protein